MYQRFCTTCGQERGPVAAFCRRCGAAFPAELPHPPAESQGYVDTPVPRAVAVTAPGEPEPEPLPGDEVPVTEAAVADPVAPPPEPEPRPGKQLASPRGRLPVRALVLSLAIVAVVAVGVYAFVLRANSEAPSESAASVNGPSESSDSTDAPPDGARATNLRSLVPLVSKVVATHYPDLDGDGVEDIVALAERPTGEKTEQPYVRAYIWHDGDWRTAFNALLDPPDITTVPGRYLTHVDGPSPQVVTTLEPWDADGDGADELVFVTESLTARGTRRAWLLSFPERNAHVSFFAEVDGKVRFSPAGLTLDGVVLRTTDPDCCGPEGATYSIRFDPEKEAIVVTPQA